MGCMVSFVISLSLNTGYLRNYNCCWVGCVVMLFFFFGFFNQIKCFFSVNDDDDERHISHCQSLCINVIVGR